MYYCNICNYQTSILNDIKKHYNSQEHIMNTYTPKMNNVLKIKDLESKNKELAYKNEVLKKSIDNNDENDDD